MRDMLEARKRGDFAFRDKDFKTAIDCYSQVCFMFVLCFKCSALSLATCFNMSLIQIANMHGHYIPSL